MSEACAGHCPAHLTYASTSSVYGANTRMPFFGSIAERIMPLQFYVTRPERAANEFQWHIAYSNIFASFQQRACAFSQCIARCRQPNMALFLFTKNIIEGKPMRAFQSRPALFTRDFTYVDNIVECVYCTYYASTLGHTQPELVRRCSSIQRPPKAPFRIYNIGNNQTAISSFWTTLRSNRKRRIGRESISENLPMQQGDSFLIHGLILSPIWSKRCGCRPKHPRERKASPGL